MRKFNTHGLFEFESELSDRGEGRTTMKITQRSIWPTAFKSRWYAQIMNNKSLYIIASISLIHTCWIQSKLTILNLGWPRQSHDCEERQTFIDEGFCESTWYNKRVSLVDNQQADA